jgi:alkylhydroperoxidase family enzyme
VAQDDWRLRIELGPEGAHGLLRRLGVIDTDADELAQALHDRLAVTRDEDTVFVYAASQAQLDRARPAIEAELAKLSLEPELIRSEHWLEAEERWDDEPAGETPEEEVAAHGYAPWEVRIPCGSHEEAKELALRLEADGYGVVRRWSYVIAGTATKEQAEELAKSLHGEVEPGGELVWEVPRRNPFAIFGGLGGAGTPL